MTTILLGFLISFVLSLFFTWILIKYSKKAQIKQTILHYVKEHTFKQGTPTMGGLAFLLAIIITSFIILKINTYWVFGLAVGCAFGLLGFLDDFIKIKYKQNLGLRAYQKIIGQFGIAIILAFYIYFYSGQAGRIVVPFVNLTIDIGWGIIPLVIFVCLALTNAVNLIDGLDGLSSNVSIVFFAGIFVLIFIFKQQLFNSGETEAILNNYNNMLILISIIIGALFAFLIFNTNKASIFMGDVGSLGIGGLATSICCLTGFEFFVPLIGIMFVITALSDIIQVLHFKRTKKRVFLMAPIHHHFQMKGFSESKIVFVYSAITALISIITIILTLIFSY